MPVPKKLPSKKKVEVDLTDDDAFDVSSSGDELERKVAAKPKVPPRKLGPSTSQAKLPAAKKVVKAPATKKKHQSSDDEKPAKKSKKNVFGNSSDGDSDFEADNVVAPPRAAGGGSLPRLVEPALISLAFVVRMLILFGIYCLIRIFWLIYPVASISPAGRQKAAVKYQVDSDSE